MVCLKVISKECNLWNSDWMKIRKIDHSATSGGPNFWACFITAFLCNFGPRIWIQAYFFARNDSFCSRLKFRRSKFQMSKFWRSKFRMTKFQRSNFHGGQISMKIKFPGGRISMEVEFPEVEFPWRSIIQRSNDFRAQTACLFWGIMTLEIISQSSNIWNQYSGGRISWGSKKNQP